MNNMKIQEYSASWVQISSVDEFEKLIQQNACDKNKIYCLDLTRHTYSDQDIKRIAAILTSGKCPKGTHINFERIKIKGSSIKYLEEALISGNCPEDLTFHLNICDIGDEGAKYFANALQSRNCPKGLGIDLYANNITAVGIGYFIQALDSKNCPTGLKLNLSENEINGDAMLAIGKALKNCPKDLLLDLQMSTTTCREKKLSESL